MANFTNPAAKLAAGFQPRFDAPGGVLRIGKEPKLQSFVRRQVRGNHGGRRDAWMAVLLAFCQS